MSEAVPPKILSYAKVTQDLKAFWTEKGQGPLYKIPELTRDTVPDSLSYEQLLIDLNHAIQKNARIGISIKAGDGTKDGKVIDFPGEIDLNVSFESKIRRVGREALIGDFVTMSLLFGNDSKYRKENDLQFFLLTLKADEAGSYSQVMSHSLIVGGEHPNYRDPTIQELKEFMQLIINALTES